jgi:hypothetical protein
MALGMLGLVIQLAYKGPKHHIQALFANIVEVKVEIELALGGSGLFKIFDNGRSKDCLAASRNPIEPQEGVPL